MARLVQAPRKRRVSMSSEVSASSAGSRIVVKSRGGSASMAASIRSKSNIPTQTQPSKPKRPRPSWEYVIDTSQGEWTLPTLPDLLDATLAEWTTPTLPTRSLSSVPSRSASNIVSESSKPKLPKHSWEYVVDTTHGEWTIPTLPTVVDATISKARLVDIKRPDTTSSRRSMRLSMLPRPETADSISPGTAANTRPQSRNVSGVTLVGTDSFVDQPEQQQLLRRSINALDLGWDVDKLSVTVDGSRSSASNKLKKRNSVRMSLLADVVTNAASSLGKRAREAYESGKDQLQGSRSSDLLASRTKTRVAVHPAPNLLTITETQTIIKPSTKTKKRWLSAGLYLGQERDFDARLTTTKNKLKRKSEGNPTAQNAWLPLPMFAGERLLATGRDFKLPFDVFSPLPPGQPRPDEWRKTSTNRFVGHAASEWKRHKPLPASSCLCTLESGCDDDCLNRHMFYECDDNNCNIGAEHCTNRAFADLKERCQSSRKYDIGVEVIKTPAKGFGVRVCRTFEPQQIILEYAGEIITQDECFRRMKEEYGNNECYYLMSFDQNMIIDATRGSMARFINHSCEPNCRMVKWTVAGKPRMALFAGDHGIMTGEELTYDYNFDPFSQKNVQTCHCSTASCRGFLGPRPTKPVKEKLPEEKGKQPKASGILAGAKRKLQHLLHDPDARTPLVANKRRRVTVDGASAPLPKQTANNRTVSSASTLVEKENLVPSGPIETSIKGKYRITKSTATKDKGRRNTMNVLSRVASTLKRNASTLKRNASTLKRSASTMTSKASSRRGARKSAPSVVPLFQPLTLDFEDRNGEAYEDEGLRKDVRSPSVRSEPGTIKRGIVRSVRGRRREEAMRKLGLGVERVGRSVRLVEEEEDEDE